MNDLNVIDEFMATFIRYIDSGFGLLGGDVHALTSILIGIDVTLAALFWAGGAEQDIMLRFVRKILAVGAFAYILGNFATLADIVFRSFSTIGLKAGGGAMSADDLLKPGRLAGTGFQAAWPLLDQAAKLSGFALFFNNFLEIMVLLVAWALVILAFFLLAVQLFVTILEFKLTALAGFVLVPFAFWNRTSFLAERVLGNIVSSGIKVMVLAVIVGIGSTYFAQFTAALQGHEPDIGQAMSLVLASLALFGIGIYGPTIASGLVAGAPQLGAGAVAGTAVGVAGIAMAGASAGGAAAGAGIGAVRAATSMGAAGSSTLSSGRSAVATAQSDMSSAGPSEPTGRGAARGHAGTSQAMAGPHRDGVPSRDGGEMPDWARELQATQAARHRHQLALQAIRDGDHGGASASPDISEKEN